VVGADVATPDGARAVAAAATARFGRADVLVNNAGVGDSGPLLDESPEEWESTLRINLTGAFLVTQAVHGAALLVDGGTAVVDPTAEALG
jgi:NAD(P)-dependent dehydrogenase (short-subunit alcohol dehydrogenase family)